METSLRVPQLRTHTGWHHIDPDADGVAATSSDIAGPAGDFTGPPVPAASTSRTATAWRMTARIADTALADSDRLGDTLAYPMPPRELPSIMISNPAHIKSLMVEPDLAPSATASSPLRPVVGPNSVLTAIGARHRRQRGLLMPQFHGAAMSHYTEAIDRATAEHIGTVPIGTPIRAATLGQMITLDVIMFGVFGVTDEATSTSAEYRLRRELLRMLYFSTRPVATLVQMLSPQADASFPRRLAMRRVDRAIHEVVTERRREGGEGSDILSVLLSARTEDGDTLTDNEIRDELLTLLLAGHETTANTIAWTFERLVRHPEIYRRARQAADHHDDAYLDAVLNESMRSRPLIPMFARQVTVDWRFGEYRVPAGSVVLISTVLLHHRSDIYTRPFAFDPDRFVGVRPAPNTLMPFGGGNRRCLGANLAMAELRTAVGEILRRLDLECTDEPAERPQHRNVTMIPGGGGTVVVRRRR